MKNQLFFFYVIITFLFVWTKLETFSSLLSCELCRTATIMCKGRCRYPSYFHDVPTQHSSKYGSNLQIAALPGCPVRLIAQENGKRSINTNYLQKPLFSARYRTIDQKFHNFWNWTTWCNIAKRDLHNNFKILSHLLYLCICSLEIQIKCVTFILHFNFFANVQSYIVEFYMYMV